jgi:hypothetical protein
MTLNFFKFAGTWDEMDVLARAQFFEGYLHVRPFGMIRGALGKSQLLKMIAKALAEFGGTPNPEWLSKGDTGLYRATFAAVNKAIRSQHGERAIEAVDILQTMMGLAGWEDETGEALEVGGKSPFWMAGKYVSEHSPDKLTSGQMVPYDAAGLSIKIAYRRALDVIRQEADRAKKRHEQYHLIEEETMGPSESEEGDWGQIVDALFANPSSSVSQKFFRWLTSKIPHIMRRGEGAKLILDYLELMQAGVVKTDTEAAEALGTTPSGLSNTKKVFTASMTDYLQRNPQAQEEMEDMFSDVQFFRNLFQGQISSPAQRVAHRALMRMAGPRGMFELVYSTGGTGGPYPSEAEAKKWAEKLLRGGRDEWIAVIPAEDLTDLKKAKALWVLKRDEDWEKGPRPLPNVPPHAHYFASEKLSAKSLIFTLKKDLKLKDGILIPKGTPVTLDFSDTEKKLRATGTAYASLNPDYSALPLHPQRMGLQIKIENLHWYLDRFPKMPGLASLERMNEKGIATTPMGEKVEPDSYGPSGAPSWLLVAGVI